MTFSSSSSWIEPAKQFLRQRCLRLPKLLPANLLQRAVELSGSLPFQTNRTEVGEREICDHPGLRGLLMLLFNRAPLFRFLEELTGKGPIQSFEGTVYRLLPGQTLSWHDDHPGVRQLALSLGLSPQPYEGGEFQLRLKGETALLLAAAGLSPGEALLFDVAADLEHRVTPLLGAHPRVAFAGWFMSCPLQTLVKRS